MRLMIFAIIWFFIVLMSATVFADVISILADEWCPYNCKPNSKNPGYMIEIAKQIFERNGHKIQYSIMPWARAIMRTREGDSVAIVGAYIEDAPDFVFPKPWGSSTMGCFARKGSEWRYQGLNSLKSVSIGVILGYSYGEDIDHYIKENKKYTHRVQTVTSMHGLNQNIEKLLLGRIDVTIENDMVFRYHLKQTGRSMDQFQNVGIVSKDNVHIAFSPKNKKSPRYSEMVNQGIKTLRSSGKLKQILDKYGLKDWE